MRKGIPKRGRQLSEFNPLGAFVTARRTLTRQEARAVYDRIGRWQDTQAFYEAPAFDEVIAAADFESSQSILEIGCGTGRLAERLLRDHCPPEACYTGVDLSPAMVELARNRLSPYGSRAQVVLTDGAFSFDVATRSQDRVVATYVLDLLSPEDIRALLAESHRVLEPSGRLCLAGLTWGEGLWERIISRLWAGVHAVRPEWVGGCRPLQMHRFLDPGRWTVSYQTVLCAWGVSSEVLIVTPV